MRDSQQPREVTNFPQLPRVLIFGVIAACALLSMLVVSSRIAPASIAGIAMALIVVARAPNSVIMGLSASVIAIAVAGLIDWTYDATLVGAASNIMFRPYTAMALASIAAALWCATAGALTLARLLAVLPLLYGALALLIEYGALTVEPDGFLAQAFDPTKHHAFVSLPNSALALVWESLGLLLWPSSPRSRLRISIVWTCGIMATLIALLSATGHIFDIARMRSWTGEGAMSWLVTLSHGSLGVAMILASRGISGRRNWLPVIFGIATVAAGVSGWLLLIPREEARVDAATRTVLSLVSQQLESDLRSVDDALVRLGERLASGMSERLFRADAAHHLRDHPALLALRWRSGATAWQTMPADTAVAEFLERNTLASHPPRASIERINGRAAKVQTWQFPEGQLDSVVDVGSLASLGIKAISDEYSIELRRHNDVLFTISGGGRIAARVQSASIMAGDERMTLLAAPGPSVLGVSASRLPEVVLLAGFGVGVLLILALRLAGDASESAATAELVGNGLRREVDAHRDTGAALLHLRDSTDSILSTITDGFVTIDRSWQFTFINRSAARILGVDPEAIVGETLQASAVLTRYRDELTATMHEQRTADFEVAQLPPDRAISVRAFAQPAGIALYLRDVSAERQAAERVAKNRAMLVHAQRIAKFGIWHCDDVDADMTWSEALYDILGVQPNQVQASFDALVAAAHPDDRLAVAAGYEALRTRRASLDLEHRMLWPDGSTRHVHSLALLEGSPGVGWLSGTVQDISENKHKEGELTSALRRAERQASQLRVLSYVSLIANRKLGDADLLQVLVEEVREAIGAHMGTIHMLPQSLSGTSAPIVSLSDKYARWRAFSEHVRGLGLMDESVHRQGVLRLTDEALNAHPARHGIGERADEHPRLRGLLSVALRDRSGALLGFLQLSDRYDGDFTADDEVVLVQFAQIFSIAIGWAKLIDELKTAHGNLNVQLNVLARSRAVLDEAERVARLGSWEIDFARSIGERQRTWSEQMFRLFGLEPGIEPPDVETIALLVHPDDRDGLKSSVEHAMARKESFSKDFRICVEGGAVRWIHTEARFVAQADGIPLRITGTSQDVTERKIIEQETIARAEVLRGIATGVALADTLAAIVDLYETRFPNALCSILLLGDDGRLRTASAPHLPAEYSQLIDGIEIGPCAGSCGTAAWRREQVIVQDIANDPLWESWRDAAARFHLGACWSTPVLNSEGNVIATFAIYYASPREPTPEECRKIASVVSIATIAIESHRSHQRLATSEQRLRSLFAYVPEAVFAQSLDGRIIDCNEAAEAATGFDRAALTTYTLPDIVAEECRELVAESVRRAALGEVRRIEYEGVRPDGKRYNAVSATLPIVVQGTNVGVYAIVRDVTAELAAKAELERALREAHENNRELQEFAFVASHDLQEPLRKVRAFGDRLRAHAADALDEEGVRYIERMRSAAERMQHLIDDLLAYSLLSTRGRTVIQVDLDRVLNEVLVDLEARVAETAAVVVFDRLPFVEADPTQMRQLLQNLLGNSLKFHRPGRRPEIAVRAEIVRQAGANLPALLRMRVVDNGIGFDNRSRERIFAPLQRLHGRNEYEGSGVGLAIARRIVERHGGTLSAHGKTGHGAQFVVELPMSRPAPSAPNTVEEKSK